MTTGTEGNDTLVNEDGHDHVDALGGDDVITAILDIDFPNFITVDGGAGFDILNFFANVLSPTGNLDSVYGRHSSSINGTVSWTNIERFVLTFTQYSGSTPVVLGAAEDWVTSNRNGNVALLLETGGGNDRVIFTDMQVGSDIKLGLGDDTVDFSASAPTRNAIFKVDGGEGNDSLVGSAYRDEFHGGSGDDFLDGRGTTAGQPADLLVGGSGNDIYVVHAGDTILENAGEGTDEVRTALRSFILPEHFENLTVTAGGTHRANAADNVVTGSDSADLFYLHDGGDDTAFGNGGNDFFYFGAAYTHDGDTVDGGAGYDFLLLQGNYTGTNRLLLGSAAQLSNVESIHLLSGSDNRYGGATGALLSYQVDIFRFGDFPPPGTALEINGSGLGVGERLEFSGAGAGSDIRFKIYGGASGDILSGGAGDDIIDGGGGIDDMGGGQGDDIYFVDHALDRVQENTPGGNDTVYASVSFSLEPYAGQVENLATRDFNGTDPIALHGNAIANRITGNAGNNSLYGRDGNDVLIGGAGNDNLFGGVGRDDTRGGLGNDVHWVDDAFDVAREVAGEGTDSVYTTVSYKLRADSEIELLGTQDKNGTAPLVLTGNGFANTITGNAGNNKLYGEGGNDALFGLDGNDHLFGGAGVDNMRGGVGDDVYHVDNVGDLAIETAGSGFDQVYATASFALTAGSSIELLGTLDNGATTPLNLTGNGEAQTIVGNAGANILLGLGGRDSLIGGAGADLLDGGEGDDVYEGGAGADRFRFSDTLGSGPGNPLGWIRDFASEDMIDLAMIDANRNTAGDDAFIFLGTGAFTGVAGQLRYDMLGATVRLFGDVNGDGLADFYIDVNGAVPVAADFVL